MASITLYPFDFLDIPNVGVAFTSRNGGVSESPYDSANISFEVGDDPESVRQNRLSLSEKLGLTGWCECLQIHSDILHHTPEPIQPESAPTLEGDGMTTATPGHGLIIKTADCQPLLLAHESGLYIAGLHIGWRGNKCNFPQSGVKRFCEAYAIQPSEVHAVRGPSLGPQCAEFRNFTTDFGGQFQSYLDPRSQMVDLWQLTHDQLIQAGLQPQNIHSLDLCTMSMNDSFFSYRKACATPCKQTGRQAGIIWIKKA